MDKLTPPKPLYWVAIAFISAIFSSTCLDQIPIIPLYVALILLILSYLVLYLTKRAIYLRIGILLLACFITGMWRMNQAVKLPPDHIAHIKPDNIEVYTEGMVSDEPVIYQPRRSSLHEERTDTNPYGHFILNVQAISVGHQPDKSAVEGLVRVNFNGESPEIKYGDFVGVAGTISEPASPTNPGEFDYRQHLARQGIYKIIRCDEAERIKVITEGQGNPLLRAVYGIRRVIARKIDRMFSQNRIPLFKQDSFDNTTSLLKILLLGDRSSFSPKNQDQFMKTGTIHFLSVSGLHLGIVVAICFMVFWWLGIIGRPRIILTMIIAICYTGITGLDTPIVRSLVMLLCYFGAELFNRKPNSLNSLALAAIIITAYNPNEVFSIGAQLSFIAVLFIIILMPWILELIRGKPDPEEALARILPPTILERGRKAFKEYLIGSVAVSVSVWGGMILLTLYYFHIVTPVAMLANIVLSFLIFILMLLGFVLLPFMLIGENVVILVVHSLCWLINVLINLMAMIPLAYVYLPDIPQWLVKLFYGLFFLSPLLFGKSRLIGYLKIGVRSVMVLMMGLTIMWVIWTGISGRSPLYQTPDNVTLTMLDVRQGASFVIETPNGKISLFDTGASGMRDTGKNIIAPYLWQRGVARIDELILSHPHSDHINGVPSLIDRFRIKEVVVNSYFRQYPPGLRLLKMFRDEPKIIRIGETLQIGDYINAEVLGPPEGLFAHKRYWNNTSTVLKLDRGILLCGDIEKSGIELLMNNPLNLTGITVMQLPHHGFPSSFVPEFIRMVNPDYALLNTGSTRQVEKLCEDIGIEVFASYRYGAVTILFKKSGLEIVTYKHDVNSDTDH